MKKIDEITRDRMNPQRLYVRELRQMLVMAIGFILLAYLAGWTVAWVAVGWILRSVILLFQLREAAIEERVQALRSPSHSIGRN
jgi:hypothetical protein